MTQRTVLLLLVVLTGGCASAPEPVQQFESALARYLGPAQPLRNPAPTRVQTLAWAVAPGGFAMRAADVGAALQAGVERLPALDLLRRVPDSYLLAVPGRGTVQQAGRVYGVDAVLMASVDVFEPQQTGLTRLLLAQGEQDMSLTAGDKLAVLDVALLPASGVPALLQTSIRRSGPDALARLRREAPAELAAKLRGALSGPPTTDASVER